MNLQLEPCLAPAWSRGGHAQTLWGYFLPSRRLGESPREAVDLALADGDRLVGAHYSGGSGVTVHIFHGLGGDIDSSYMHRTARVALDLGHSVYLWNHRGSGAGAGLARGSGHSGRAEDVSQAIAFGRARAPSQRHWAIGFSMGANSLLLLLTGRRGTELPDAAIAVNAPIHLSKASQKLRRGLNRLYDWNFVMACRRDVARRRAVGLLSGDYRIPLGATIHDFDEIFTAPVNGFRDREDYYASCSTHLWLRNIRTPTVILTAKDDPFVDWEDYRDAKLSSAVHLHVEATGGHMGYLTNRPTPLGNLRWQDYAIHESLRALRG